MGCKKKKNKEKINSPPPTKKIKILSVLRTRILILWRRVIVTIYCNNYFFLWEKLRLETEQRNCYHFLQIRIQLNFLNGDPVQAAFLMQIQIMLLKNVFKLPYEEFSWVEKDKKDCWKLKTMELVQIYLIFLKIFWQLLWISLHFFSFFLILFPPVSGFRRENECGSGSIALIGKANVTS